MWLMWAVCITACCGNTQNTHALRGQVSALPLGRAIIFGVGVCPARSAGQLYFRGGSMVKKLTPYLRAPELASSSSVEEAIEKLTMKELKSLRRAIKWQIKKLNEQENNLSQSYKEYYNLASIVRKIKTGEEECNWNILIKFGMCTKSIQQIQHNLVEKIKAVEINPNEISIENLTKLQNIIKNIIKQREKELKSVESEIEKRKGIREAIIKSTHQAINSGKYVNLNNLKQLYGDNKKVFGD
jgi:hypothetical protein